MVMGDCVFWAFLVVDRAANIQRRALILILAEVVEKSLISSSHPSPIVGMGKSNMHFILHGLPVFLTYLSRENHCGMLQKCKQHRRLSTPESATTFTFDCKSVCLRYKIVFFPRTKQIPFHKVWRACLQPRRPSGVELTS